MSFDAGTDVTPTGWQATLQQGRQSILNAINSSQPIAQAHPTAKLFSTGLPGDVDVKLSGIASNLGKAATDVLRNGHSDMLKFAQQGRGLLGAPDVPAWKKQLDDTRNKIKAETDREVDKHFDAALDAINGLPKEQQQPAGDRFVDLAKGVSDAFRGDFKAALTDLEHYVEKLAEGFIDGLVSTAEEIGKRFVGWFVGLF